MNCVKHTYQTVAGVTKDFLNRSNLIWDKANRATERNFGLTAACYRRVGI
jgi:hypothetical protein